MTWGNPLAWLGAFAVLVPLLAHFFTRRPGSMAPFPTLRFVPRSRLVPAWSRTPSDIALMVVRMTILLLATAALARPRLAVPPAAGASVAARIVLIDSSWSMLQRDADGAAPIESAMQLGRALADSADVARVVYTPTPGTELAAAVAWLNTTRGTTRELIVVSDFQSGTIDSGAVARLASQVGFRAVRVPHVALALQRVTSRSGDSLTVTDFALEPEATVVRYRATVTPAELSSRIAIGNGDTTADARLLRLVANHFVLPSDTLGNPSNADGASEREVTVALHLSDSRDWDGARASASPIGLRAQAALVARLAADPQLERAALDATPIRMLTAVANPPFVVIARNRTGDVIVDAAARGATGEMMVFAHVPMLSPASVAVLAALERSTRTATPVREQDATVIDSDVLDQIATTAAVQSTAIDDTEIGRWVWLVVLLALAVEWWMRRAMQDRALWVTSVDE